MSSNLKLVFVPVWLEKILKASNESLSSVLDTEKINRIVSRSDLDLYSQIQGDLGSLFGTSVFSSFANGPQGEAVCCANLDDEQKRGYLYGFLPNTEHLPVNPVFIAHHVGYDYVIVTVAEDQETQDIDSVIIMGELLGILSSVHPLEEVAKLPIMETWLKVA